MGPHFFRHPDNQMTLLLLLSCFAHWAIARSPVEGLAIFPLCSLQKFRPAILLPTVQGLSQHFISSNAER